MTGTARFYTDSLPHMRGRRFFPAPVGRIGLAQSLSKILSLALMVVGTPA